MAYIASEVRGVTSLAHYAHTNRQVRHLNDLSPIEIIQLIASKRFIPLFQIPLSMEADQNTTLTFLL